MEIEVEVEWFDQSLESCRMLERTAMESLVYAWVQKVVLALKVVGSALWMMWSSSTRDVIR